MYAFLFSTQSTQQVAKFKLNACSHRTKEQTRAIIMYIIEERPRLEENTLDKYQYTIKLFE
jgi:hypothetical protein